MFSSRYSAATAALFYFIAPIEATYSASSHKNLAVYWGQGANQEGLRAYCDAPEIDVIPIGFINLFTAQADGLVQENFGNMCWGGSFFPGSDGNPSPLYTRCPQLQEDLYYCQQSTNTKIVLSLGGDSKDYQITGADEGIALAEFLWGAYGPYDQAWVDKGNPRPLDRGLYNTNLTMKIDVDGFDFDIEHTSTDLSAGYIACIHRLRELFARSTSGKQYLITGAPQCPLPEQNMGTMISGAKFDALFIQFYNNDGYGCTGRNWTNANPSYNGVKLASGFNYDAWTTFISGGESSAAKLYIGLPANNADGATDDYLKPSEARNLVSAYQGEPNFGGVMLWEATGATANVQDADLPLVDYPGLNYYQVMRDILDDTIPTISSSTSSLPTSTSTSSSFSSTGNPVSTTSSSSSSSSSVPTSTVTSSLPPSTGIPTSITSSSLSSSSTVPTSTVTSSSSSSTSTLGSTANSVSPSSSSSTSLSSGSSVKSTNSASLTVISNFTTSATTPISSTTSISSVSGVVTSSSTFSSGRYSTLPPFRNTTSAALSSSSSSFLVPTTVSFTLSTIAPIQTPTQYITSTVYGTKTYTITSCAAAVTNCPAKIGRVTTEVFSLYTTIYPVAGPTEVPSSLVDSAASKIVQAGSGKTTTVSSTSTSFVTVNVIKSTATVLPLQSAPYPTGGSSKVRPTGTGFLPSVSLSFKPVTSNAAKAVKTPSSSATPVPSKALTAGAGSVKVGSALLAVAGVMMLL